MARMSDGPGISHESMEKIEDGSESLKRLGCDHRVAPHDVPLGKKRPPHLKHVGLFRFS
jgi:hypothetical protein